MSKTTSKVTALIYMITSSYITNEQSPSLTIFILKHKIQLQHAAIGKICNDPHRGTWVVGSLVHGMMQTRRSLIHSTTLLAHRVSKVSH